MVNVETMSAITMTTDDGRTATVDGVTTLSDTTPCLSGHLGAATLGAGEQLAIYVGDTHYGNATINPDGSWSYAFTSQLPNGAFAVSARIEDATTHEAHSSVVTDLNIDATPATQTASITSVEAGGGSDSIHPVLTGSLDHVLSVGQVVAVYDTVGTGALRPFPSPTA